MLATGRNPVLTNSVRVTKNKEQKKKLTGDNPLNGSYDKRFFIKRVNVCAFPLPAMEMIRACAIAHNN